METSSLNIRVRVLDSERRLLFVLNRKTRKIEIVPVRGGKAQGARRKKYFVSLDTLNFLLLPSKNVEVVEVVAEEEEDA